MTDIPKGTDKIEWTISVPILHNSIILKQLGIAIGIPFGVLIVFLLIVKAFYGVGLILALFLLTYFFIRLVWGGKYEAGFELNRTGIRNYTLEKQAKKNRIINLITILSGFLTGKPAVAGAGFLAQSGQDVVIRWKNIKKVNYLPAKSTVIVKGGLTDTIAVFCTSENYPEVKAFILLNLKGVQS